MFTLRADATVAEARGALSASGHSRAPVAQGGHLDAPDGDYTTIAGLLLTAPGRTPDQPGDVVTLTDWTLEVTAVDGHAISGETRLPGVGRPDPGHWTHVHGMLVFQVSSSRSRPRGRFSCGCRCSRSS